MARGDALDLEVFGRVAGEFEDFGREVFEDGGYVDGGCLFVEKKRYWLAFGALKLRRWGWGKRRHTFGADAHLVLRVVLEETLDTTAGELDWRITVSHFLDLIVSSLI